MQEQQPRSLRDLPGAAHRDQIAMVMATERPASGCADQPSTFTVTVLNVLALGALTCSSPSR
jgi:hypothetical protein